MPPPNLYPRNHSERKGGLRNLRLWILEIPRAVGIRSHIQDRVLKYQRLNGHLPVQERNNAKFSIDTRHLDDIAARKYGRVLHAEMINVNRYREQGECQSPDFDLLSSFLLQIGDYLRPVAIHFNECGSKENKHQQE